MLVYKFGLSKEICKLNIRTYLTNFENYNLSLETVIIVVHLIQDQQDTSYSFFNPYSWTKRTKKISILEFST